MEVILTQAVVNYIRELSSVPEKSQIVQYLDRQAELGFRLKRPVSAALRSGIMEIRPGAHRLLFFYDRGRIIVCHVFRKKTDKVTVSEIKTAVANRLKFIAKEGV